MTQDRIVLERVCVERKRKSGVLHENRKYSNFKLLLRITLAQRTKLALLLRTIRIKRPKPAIQRQQRAGIAHPNACFRTVSHDSELPR